jgi:peroxiredoxin
MFDAPQIIARTEGIIGNAPDYSEAASFEKESLMARIPSAMTPLGTLAPDFSLPDVVGGKPISRDGAAGPKGLLVMFICRHCPFVKHVQDELARLGRDYAGRGVGIVAISANDESGFPEDRPEKLAEMSKELGLTFPYLHDESQEVARAYDAQCTPDFFLYDAGRRLVYRGQLDDSRPGSDIPVTGADLRAAVDALIAGSPIAQAQRPSIGCNIKWK